MKGARVLAAIGGHGRNGPCALVATIVVVFALMLHAGLARAQANVIESVTSAQQGAQTVLRIQLKAPPKLSPASFSIANPPRLALDFLDTGSTVGTAPIELVQGEARSVNVVQAGNRARMVLNLRRPVTHTTVVEGNAILVTLEPVSGIGGAPAMTAASSNAYSFATTVAVITASMRPRSRYSRSGCWAALSGLRATCRYIPCCPTTATSSPPTASPVLSRTRK
jgi:hypothetical protein